MADLSVTPVASQIKPVPGMSLGEMMNFARGAQAYQQTEQMNPLLLQQQRQVVDTGQIALTLEQQKEQERQRLIPFLQDPKNLQSDGRFDINKVNADILKLAPLTGAKFIEDFTQLRTLQTQSDQAIQSLSNDERNVIASALGAAGRRGVKDRAQVYELLDDIQTQYPQSPTMRNLIKSYKGQLRMAGPNADLPSLLIGAANQVMSPAQQQQSFAPQGGTINTGAATFPTTTRPSVVGEAPTTTVGQTPLVTAQLPPNLRFEDAGLDINNRRMFTVRMPDGTVAGTISAGDLPPGVALPGQEQLTPTGAMPVAPQPGMPRPPAQPTMGQPTPQPVQPTSGLVPTARLRPGETPQTAQAANDIRLNSMNAAQQVPLQTFNNNQIIKLADDVITGKGANFIGALTGGYAGLPFTSDNATNLNQLGHYMALQTASLANSSGLGGTDAARGIAGEISGTTSWTAPAIKQTARVNRALSTATDLFNQGVQNAFGKSNDPFAARDFQNRWSQTVDINAVRLFDAIKNNDQQAIREVVNAAGGQNSPGAKRLTDNIGRMQQLIKGQ